MKYMLIAAFAASLAACGKSTPVSPASASIAVSASPSPIAGGACTGCGAGSTDRESKTTLTLQDSGGVAGTVTSIAMTLTANAGGQTIAQGSFDTTAITALAGTARIAANGSLAITCGVHYPASSAGVAATLTYSVHVTDDHGNQLSRDLIVPVTAT